LIDGISLTETPEFLALGWTHDWLITIFVPWVLVLTATGSEEYQIYCTKWQNLGTHFVSRSWRQLVSR